MIIKEERKVLFSLPKPFQVNYFSDWFDREINNDGFIQYFDNSSGQFAYHTNDILEQLNIKDISLIFNKALKIINPDNISKSNFIEEHRTLSENLSASDEEKLNKLDQEYYKHDDKLEKALPKYLKENRKALYTTENN